LKTIVIQKLTKSNKIFDFKEDEVGKEVPYITVHSFHPNPYNNTFQSGYAIYDKRNRRAGTG